MRIDFQNAILLVLCLVLLLFVFTLSASAETSSEFEPLPSVSSSSLPLSSYKLLYDGDYGSLYLGASDQNSDDVYCFASSVSGSNRTVVFASKSPNQVVIRRNNSITYATNNYNDFTKLYYINTTFPATGSTYYVPQFSSIQEGLNALSSALSEPASPFTYSLPPGNVAYIPIPSGQSSAITYTLTTTYYMAFGNNDTSRVNQVVTVMSSLPSSSNNVAPSSPKIPWTNNGNVNLLGVSANKIYQSSIPTNYGGQYLVIVNPMTMPSQTGLIGGDTYTNGSINISVSAVSGSPHIYPMTESLTITPGDGIGSESSYGDSGYTYVVDPETGEVIWTDPSGGSSAPVAGGNNPMPSPNTIFDWLRNISQQFSDFLRGPVQAVQVVVSAIRDFMGSFTQLYQWLPSPVYSLITSALMIALTIGVIKIFV